MFQFAPLEQLEERKRLLVAESERHRRALMEQLQNLESAAAWVERGLGLARSLRGWWPVLAPVAGFLFARRRRRLLDLLWRCWRWLRAGKAGRCVA
ncbi:MAG: hypothetical protein KGJ60_08710 [Verrucomicrobiota bacterium]|nr:hypothetical protein [Verrucomicrobiota bacterium]